MVLALKISPVYTYIHSCVRARTSHILPIVLMSVTSPFGNQWHGGKSLQRFQQGLTLTLLLTNCVTLGGLFGSELKNRHSDSYLIVLMQELNRMRYAMCWGGEGAQKGDSPNGRCSPEVTPAWGARIGAGR